VGFIAGAGGSLVKMMVNYSVQLFLGIPGAFILLGIGIASVSHIIFGGLGGIIAALVIARLLRAGVISREHRG
jgi:glycopeptide antibiotics resistance protein